MAGQQYHLKRRPQSEEEEAFVDDLTIAAQYAFAVPADTTPATTCKDVACADEEKIEIDDENEIDLGQESSSSLTSFNANPAGEHGDDQVISTDSAGTGEATVGNEDNAQLQVDVDDDDDSSSRAESDVDLTEQLARMEGGDDDETAPTTTTNKPMTANEIDAYQADIRELPDQFHWNVALETEIIAAENACMWMLAGSLQHHVVDERTVVVLSAPGAVLLQEGSVLAVQGKDISTIDKSIPAIIPLGKIFEVFGPVSQPLYSIRLALPAIVKNLLKGETNVLDGKTVDEKSNIEASSAVISSLPGTSATVHDKMIEEKVSECSQQTAAAITRGILSAPTLAETSATEELIDSRESAPMDPDATKLALQPAPQADIWSKNGNYTKLLKVNPKLPVYFFRDSSGRATTVLDTAAVYRNSGRGCDASNIFDEEILDAEDFSDDEQERMVKGQRKKKGRGKVQHQIVSSSSSQQEILYSNRNKAHPPQGFHQSVPQCSSFPQGFHQGASQPNFNSVYAGPPPHPQQRMMPPNHSQQSYHPSMMPPPPPPPQSHYGAYPNAPQQSYYGGYPNTGQTPPPPPPGAPPQPSAEEESDTVYYDFS